MENKSSITISAESVSALTFGFLYNLRIKKDFNSRTLSLVFGENETISNNTVIKINDESSLKFNTTKDLIDDFTEYYDLMYSYITDCISINFNYNKSFYRDGNLKPNESLSFLIKIIPFTELGVPNIGKLINK